MIKIKLPSRTLLLTFEHRMREGIKFTLCDVMEAIDGYPKPIKLASGWARCAKEDTFNREKGRKRAIARALEEMGMSKAERYELWMGYFERGTTTNPIHKEEEVVH